MHIKGQGIYTLVELYSENDFYDYDRCKIESDLIVKKKNIYKDGIYYMKFLLLEDMIIYLSWKWKTDIR